MVLAGAPPSPSSTSFTILPRGPQRDHQILACTLLVPPTCLFFLRTHFGQRCRRKRIRQPDSPESVVANLCLPTAIGWKAKGAHGRFMASLVVLERHLWLNLTEMKEAYKVPFLDSQVSPTGLFGPAVEGLTERFASQPHRSRPRQCDTFCLSAPALLLLLVTPRWR